MGPPSFEVLLALGLTFWVPSHASQSLVTRPGVYLPSSRTMHLVHLWHDPLMGCIYPGGLPEVVWVLHESGYSLLVPELWP